MTTEIPDLVPGITIPVQQGRKTVPLLIDSLEAIGVLRIQLARAEAALLAVRRALEPPPHDDGVVDCDIEDDPEPLSWWCLSCRRNYVTAAPTGPFCPECTARLRVEPAPGTLAAVHEPGEHPYPQAADMPLCDSASETWMPCARLAGHPVPHRDRNGNEWTGAAPDEVYVLTPAGLAALDAPHHWEPPETPCHSQDEDETEIWLCTAQAGHGGEEHIAYGDDSEPVRRWPVQPAAAGLCHYCDVEPASVGGYCEACAPAVQLATGGEEPSAAAIIAASIATGTSVVTEDEPPCIDERCPVRGFGPHRHDTPVTAEDDFHPSRWTGPHEATCGARPYPAGSEGDDGTECMLPAGHDGKHADAPELDGDEPHGTYVVDLSPGAFMEAAEAAPEASMP